MGIKIVKNLINDSSCKKNDILKLISSTYCNIFVQKATKCSKKQKITVNVPKNVKKITDPKLISFEGRINYVNDYKGKISTSEKFCPKRIFENKKLDISNNINYTFDGRKYKIGTNFDKTDKNKQNFTIKNEIFELGKKLGDGSFSNVFSVKDKITNKLHAMKVIEKYDPYKLKCIYKEKIVLSNISHRFIIGLNYAFQNSKQLYLVLDFEEKDLYDIITTKQIKNNQRIYLCQMISAIEYLHNIGIIYRDLKPENVLLCESGIKLIDFNLVKIDIQEDEVGKDGSLGYIAPEIIEGHECTKSADWYALGVCFYEMTVQKIHNSKR